MGFVKYAPSIPVDKVCQFIRSVDALLPYWPVDEAVHDLEDGFSMTTFYSGDEKVALLIRGGEALATWSER